MMEDTFTLADTSWGLLSRPGYRSYLGQQLGEEIAKSLLAELGRQLS